MSQTLPFKAVGKDVIKCFSVECRRTKTNARAGHNRLMWNFRPFYVFAQNSKLPELFFSLSDLCKVKQTRREERGDHTSIMHCKSSAWKKVQIREKNPEAMFFG